MIPKHFKCPPVGSCMLITFNDEELLCLFHGRAAVMDRIYVLPIASTRQTLPLNPTELEELYLYDIKKWKLVPKENLLLYLGYPYTSKLFAKLLQELGQNSDTLPQNT